MPTELDLLTEWIPEQMQPGTLFLLGKEKLAGDAANPYVAVLACPACGALGLITRTQYAGLDSMICGSDRCSSEYFLNEDRIEFRKPH